MKCWRVSRSACVPLAVQQVLRDFEAEQDKRPRLRLGVCEPNRLKSALVVLESTGICFVNGALVGVSAFKPIERPQRVGSSSSTRQQAVYRARIRLHCTGTRSAFETSHSSRRAQSSTNDRNVTNTVRSAIGGHRQQSLRTGRSRGTQQIRLRCAGSRSPVGDLTGRVKTDALVGPQAGGVRTC